ncbi:MAG: cytochrome b N-terminal domain-containing protein [Euryarchaeota archaeon]|nr:cytochrome b N-terminal domain-containing protein [Euryarchaeota archaeon]
MAAEALAASPAPGFFAQNPLVPVVLGLIIALSVVFLALVFTGIIGPKAKERLDRKRQAIRQLGDRKPLTLIEKTYLILFAWIDERLRLRHFSEQLALMPARDAYYTIHRQMPTSHSDKYNVKSVWAWYPFYCLGGLAFVVFLELVITGVVLGFYYIPSGVVKAAGAPSPAYESVGFIMTDVPFGYIMRSLHHWGTHVFVAIVFLHMMRVFFTGSYKNPRELNWIIGLILLQVTLFFGYSGYLLPWDTLAVGAATIGVNMATSLPGLGPIAANLVFGGVTLSPATVLRMYWFHIFILPAIGTVLMIVHMLIVWIQGVAEPH